MGCTIRGLSPGLLIAKNVFTKMNDGTSTYRIRHRVLVSEDHLGVTYPLVALSLSPVTFVPCGCSLIRLSVRSGTKGNFGVEGSLSLSSVSARLFVRFAFLGPNGTYSVEESYFLLLSLIF